MGVKMNSLMPKKSEILQRFEIDKKTSFFSIKEMALDIKSSSIKRLVRDDIRTLLLTLPARTEPLLLGQPELVRFFMYWHVNSKGLAGLDSTY